ncbi:MAG: Spermidine synthase [Myxococcaceae bacterium]|nr:Spermidine synthase [Myxococcaceae bacterium]
MRIWKLLDRADVPGNGGELRLYQMGGHFSIRADGTELMTSHVFDSEEALATLACQRVGVRKRVRLLVGGLGMGYTLAAALRRLRDDAEVVVAELVPAVVQWNRTHLGHLAAFPLDDPRVRIYEGDVAQLLRSARGEYDAILLDVDNGPEGLTRIANNWLYGAAGLHCAQLALREDGVLAIWSATPDQAFPERMRAASFEVEEHGPRTRGDRERSKHGESHHTIWLGTPIEREAAARRERRQQDELG